ncbi:MAG: hypothetical protein WA989_06175, partial [Henriciella sp.]
AESAAQVEEILVRLATRRGPVSDRLNEAAGRVHDGEIPRRQAASEVVADLSNLIEAEGLAALQAGPDPARAPETQPVYDRSGARVFEDPEAAAEALEAEIDDQTFDMFAGAGDDEASVRADIETRLREAGQTDERVISAQGAAFESMLERLAAETGETPAKLMKRLGPKVEQAEEADAVLAQAAKSGYRGGEIGEAEEWIEASREGLDLSDEARLGRAEAMGFDMETVYYHGSPSRDIQAFERGEFGVYGPGVYATTNINEARKFKLSNRTVFYNAPKFLLPLVRPSFLFKGVAGKLYELRIRGRAVDYQTYAAGLQAVADKDPTHRFLAEEGRPGVDIWSITRFHDRLQADLKAEGFTHVKIGKDGSDVLVFDPKDLRSPDAAFNPADKASARLLAQSARKAIDTAESGKGAIPRRLQAELVKQARRAGWIGEDPAEGIDWLQAEQKGLDLSQDARWSRAAGMGFDTSREFYHGSPAQGIEAFEAGVSKFGRGVYLSTSKAFADTYKRTRGPDDYFDLWKHVKEAFSGRVYRNFVRGAIIPFRDYEARLDAEADRRGVSIEKLSSPEAVAVQDTVQAQLRAEGIAGTQISRDIFKVFAPHDIRSVDAAFDQERAGSARLLAQDDRGSFDPVQNVIRIGQGADPSTFMHEVSHWYLTTLVKLEQAGEGGDYVKSQLDDIFAWHGTKRSDAIQDSAGNPTARGIELQEAFAETFEKYLETGKAPTRKLQAAFDQFKAWLMELYRKLDPRERANLTPEISRVFDRMFAEGDEGAGEASLFGTVPDPAAGAARNWKQSEERLGRMVERFEGCVMR